MSETTRKPTPAQRRRLTDALENNGGELRPRADRQFFQVRDRMRAAGWVEQTSSRVTDAGKMAVGRADLIALPDVVVGDVLAWDTHPDCTMRVTEVLYGGKAFRGVYVTVCSACGVRSGQRADVVARESSGADYDVPVPAYQVRPARPSEVEGFLFTDADRDKACETSNWADEGTAADREAYERHTAKRRGAVTLPTDDELMMWAREQLSGVHDVNAFVAGYMSTTVRDVAEGRAPDRRTARRAYALYRMLDVLADEALAVAR